MNNTKYGFTYSYIERGLWVYTEKRTCWYDSKEEALRNAVIILNAFANDPTFKFKFKEKIKNPLTNKSN